MQLSIIFSKMQIEGASSEGNINLILKYPSVPNLSYNFSLTIKIFNQAANTSSSPLINKILHVPQKKISIGKVPGGKIYKVLCLSIINRQQYNKTIFVFVGNWENQNQQSEMSQVQLNQPASSPALRFDIAERNRSLLRNKQKSKQEDAYSTSQSLMKMVGKSVGINNDKVLDRFILNGRNCRNLGQFVGKRGSSCLQKQEMIVKGKLIFNEVYNQRQGMKFFKNDWFMGPFYSYNQNEKKLTQ